MGIKNLKCSEEEESEEFMKKEVWRDIKETSVTTCKTLHFLWPQCWVPPSVRLVSILSFLLWIKEILFAELCLEFNELKHVMYLEYFLDSVLNKYLLWLLHCNCHIWYSCFPFSLKMSFLCYQHLAKSQLSLVASSHGCRADLLSAQILDVDFLLFSQ